MTEKPNDGELERYLEGNSTLSRRYRDASAEHAPLDLDEAILARARAELKRKPGLNRALTPLAVAASLLLGVNLAWNVYQARPVPLEAPTQAKSADEALVPSPPPANDPAAVASRTAPQSPAPQPPAKRETALAGELEAIQVTGSRITQEELDQAKAGQRAEFAKQAEAQRRAMKAQDSAGVAAPYVESAPAARAAAPAAAPAAAMAEAAPLPEAQKIDRLIAYVGGLPDAVFIRNGKQHSPAEAAQHMQLKREKAGSRVKTADDFIRLCASHSSLSGEAYLIRLEDGRTRTAEDVLREELARLEGR